MSYKELVKLDKLLEDYELHIEKDFFEDDGRRVEGKLLVRTAEDRSVGQYGITIVEIDMKDKDTDDIKIISDGIQCLKENITFDLKQTEDDFYKDMFDIARLTYLYK